ncbi:MAG: hypothetical protein K0M40_22750 [Prolixibacteraceae bacterium]|nr:hypothetical protein [Prolixibacteraceae bacterium]
MRTHSTTLPEFSFYNGPITNKWPRTSANIVQLHKAIVSDYYRTKTEQLRGSTDPEQYRQAKKRLDFVTFAGTFFVRDKQNLIQPSGYCCIDFDHIDRTPIEVIKQILINDQMLDTVLLFTSPSGAGLKWIVEIDLEQFPDYEINFKGIVAYLKKTYPAHFNSDTNLIDETGKDIARACFLCHDPQAWLNPKYTNNENS